MSSHPEGMPQKQVQIDISKADTFFKKNACMKDAFPQFSQTIVSVFDISI
jgi:hypothetical protein